MNDDAPGQLIKRRRIAMNLTQQELADSTGISLRSIQRIENGEVKARAYTLKTIGNFLSLSADQLRTIDGTSPLPEEEIFEPGPLESEMAQSQKTSSLPRKLIFSITTLVVLVLGGLAFIFQSPTFPETLFESVVFWLIMAAINAIIQLFIWRKRE